MNVKDWYMLNYSSDSEGRYLNQDITFDDMLDTLIEGGSVYELFGDHIDSVIRERLFEQLAIQNNISYDFIYTLWLRGRG